jgi:hypothetical protein
VVGAETPSSHPSTFSPITNCQYSSKQFAGSVAVNGEQAEAAAAKMDFVNAYSLFCSSTKYALFVKATDGGGRTALGVVTVAGCPESVVVRRSPLVADLGVLWPWRQRNP